MNQARIESLTRSPGATASRRSLGRALAAGGLGTLFGSAFGPLNTDAKQKRNKKNNKKRTTTTVTRTVRQSVTRTFTSTVPITIPSAPPGQINLPASPYPASIIVSGFTNGAITDINLLLTDFTSSYASDVQILLSRDDGRRALVMSDIGEGISVTDIDLTLDDEAAEPLSRTAVSSGTFQPTDFGPGTSLFPDPAPAPNGNVALSTFDGADPNGIWQLWVITSGGAPGDLVGWELRITAEVDAGTVDEQVPVAKHKKHKKQGKRGR
jgi:hypothetical protein